MIEFTLPFPPSSNGLFANRKGKPSAVVIAGLLIQRKGKRGRRITAKYKSWQEEAGWELKRQKIKPIRFAADLEIELTAPDKRARDASNYIKGIEDLLVRCGILADDNSKHIRGVTARWIEGDSRPGAKVRITPV